MSTNQKILLGLLGVSAALFAGLALLVTSDDTVTKPRLVGYGCVYKVETNPDLYMFVEGPTYADEEDHFPSCVRIERNE